MRSALGIVIGLAARAEVTLFDEPYAGLDPVARQLFYDRLLADYAEHPRTVLLSTHLIDEAAGLFERVVVIDRGRIVLNARRRRPARRRDQRQRPGHRRRGVHRRAPGLGPAADRLAGVGGRGRALDEADRARAAALHLHLEPLTLQQVVVHAAGSPAASTRRKGQAHETPGSRSPATTWPTGTSSLTGPGSSWRSAS